MVDLAPLDPGVLAALAALALLFGLALPALRPSRVIDSARGVLLAACALTLVAGACLVRWDPPGLRLTLDPSTEPLLPRADPARALYAQAVREFGDDEVFVVAMGVGEVFTSEALSRLRRVTDAVAKLPGVRRVQSLTDVVSFRYDAEQDWVEVRPFLEEIPEDPARLRELRRRALADPLYRHNLVSEDGRAASLNVTFRKMSDGDFIASGLDEKVAEILAAEQADGVRFHVAGRPHLKVHVYQQMLRDLLLLIPLALAVMAGVLALVFGSWRGVVLPLATVGAATLWTFAVLALLEHPLSILTTLLAPTLIAVGSVYGVHVVNRYEEEAETSATPREAALRCLEHMRLPVLLAGATTCIGFGALLLSDVPAVFELGAFSAFGIASVTLLALTAVPSALALGRFRARSPEGAGRRFGRRLDRALERTGRFDGRWPTALLLGWTLLCVAAALALPRIVIDTDYLSYLSEDDPVRQDFEAVNRLLAGAIPLYVPWLADDPGRFRDPEALRGLERVEARAAEIPGVGHVESVVDTLRVLNRALSEDDPAAERVPDTRAGVAELLFMAPKGHLDRLTNVSHSRANLIVRTGAVGTAAVRELAARLEALLVRGDVPEGVRTGVTGNAILLARSADGIARSQPVSVGVAALAIFALVAVSLRSARLGLVAMAPNVVPVLLFFGLLGSGVAPLSLPTSLIGCVALGIAIDDTVHLLVRYREARGTGLAPEEAVIFTTRRVGRPVAITSLMLVAGFCVIALSGFATLREFGLLSAATMAICLATDLLLLPALLARIRV